MKAGFHESDITPPIGMESPGDYRKSFIEAIHDSLKVRAAVLNQGHERLAFVSVDTCELHSNQAVSEIRAEVERLCGIAPDHVVVAATHTHSGGPFSGYLPREAADAPEEIRRLMTDYSPAADPLYYDWVVAQAVTAVYEADRRKQPAVLSVGSGHEDAAVFNRRFRMSNGRTYTHPGKGNPDILEPAGPVDPEVGVLAAWTPGGDLLGCIVNYACHGTTFGGGVSGDWIRFLNTTVRRAMGTDGPVILLPGAAGDVTQVDNLSLREREFGEKWSRHVGTRVGAEVLKVLATAEKGDLGPLGARVEHLDLARRLPGRERLEAARKIVADGLRANQTGGTEWTFAKELVMLDYVAQRSPRVAFEIQALQVGPAVFLTNPAECFCRIGLDIKARSPFPFTYVVTLANGKAGYIPTEDAFEPSGGGYETVLTDYSNLEVTAAGKLLEASVGLASRFTPGAAPKAPQAPEPGDLWSYGVLGPDV